MADMIVEGGTVVTLDPKRRVIADGAVVVTGSKIEAVGNREKIGERYTADKVIRAQGKVLLPGLINTHTHIFQTLLKGIGPDLPTWEWFKAVLDPAVSHLTLEDCYISALLGSIEAIKSGTTCLLDYNYAHPHPRMADEVVRAFQQVGIRGILARGIIDMGEVHKNIVHETEEELEDCERLINQYDGLADGMVHVWLAPYSVRSTSWQGFKGAKELADRYGTGLTVHSLSPLAIESARELYGMDDLQFFENIGFLGPNVLLVHCHGHLTKRHFETMKDYGLKVSHNPLSNARLGEGIAAVPQMLGHGITVGLATDGPASNDNHDMVAALKFTALLHKAHLLDPGVITAEKVIEMATIDGAKCVALDDEIGSIESGKKADLILVDLEKPNTIAVHNPISSLVYSCTQENVDTVIVDGKVVMENREMKTVSEKAVFKEAQGAADSLIQRAGMSQCLQRPWCSPSFHLEQMWGSR